MKIDKQSGGNMKQTGLLVILIAAISFFLHAENQKIPSIDTLKTLPVQLVLDATTNEDIASPSMPVMAKNGTLFFFDVKLKQVFKTHMDNPKLIPISRSGEGPKEYAGVTSMIIENDLLYLVDWKGKILCFGLNGDFKWEEPTRKDRLDLKGKRGDKFYITAPSFQDNGQLSMDFCEWQKGGKLRLIYRLPELIVIGSSMVNGKIIKGSAIFPVSEPVFSVWNDNLFTAADSRYKFDIRGLDGKIRKSIIIDAPEPELNESQNHFASSIEKTYALMDTYYDPPYIFVISNYFRDGKPRVDLFSSDGKLKKSFIMPVKVNCQSSMGGSDNKSAVFSNRYLFYSNWEESGFQVYRVSEEVYRN
jgi:hypothetical protein